METLPLIFGGLEKHCWRWVGTDVGHAQQCREPVAFAGQHTDPKGKRHRVWSCEEHVEGLEDVGPSRFIRRVQLEGRCPPP